MSIRGVETARKMKGPAYLFNYNSQVREPSDFVKSLNSGSSKEKKQKVLSYLDSREQITDDTTLQLGEAYNQIQEKVNAIPKDGSIDSIKGELKAILTKADEQLSEEKVSDLWDLLIASSNTPEAFPADRARLTNPIRLYHLIQHRDDALNSLDNLRKYVKSAPVLPKGAVFKLPAEKTETEKPKSEDDNLQKSILTYHKVISELEQKERENRRVIQKKSDERQEKLRKEQKDAPTKQPSKEPEPIDQKEPIREAEGFSPFVFTPEVVKTLSNETKKVVQELGLSFEDKISLIAQKVEMQQTQQITRASKGKGVKTIRANSGGYTIVSQPNIAKEKHRNIPGFGIQSVPNSVGSVKPLGIGDLILVEEELIKYSLFEIAHVENILKSEFKERVHRRLEQQEESYLFESESTQETEQDLQKAERFELQKEAETVISTELNTGAEVSVSAGYGPVSVSAGANFSLSSSFQNTISKASSFAREITERSVSKIIERTLEQSSYKTLTEVEETNTHGFDNKEGDGHVIGIYRYLNKVYQAQMYNYGKRLMFEFMVPEPSAFYKHALTNQSLPGMTISMPDEEILNLSPAEISRTNYLAYVHLYQAQGVLPPPPHEVFVAKAFYQDFNKENNFTGLSSDELQVPEGYYADYFNVDSVHGIDVDNDKNKLRIIVGDRDYSLISSDHTGRNLSELTGTIPVVIKTSWLTNWGITVEVNCKLTTEKYQEWQMDTYASLIDAYNNLKSAYEAQLEAAKNEAGVGKFGQSDEMNRVTETTELRRACLSLLTDQHFELFDAMDHSSLDFPQLRVGESMTEGKYVQFFEQAFEWKNITYVFYPYFWGNKDHWIENMNIQNADTRFQEFLKAGFARVHVPVRPGYDEAVLHYLETGEIWQGGDVPAIDDDLYVSILEELYEGHETEKEPMGNPWELVVPTNLVYLQPDSTLPDLQAEADDEA